MTNLIILPILIPLFTGAILIFLNKRIMAQRVVATISSIGTIIAAWFSDTKGTNGRGSIPKCQQLGRTIWDYVSIGHVFSTY